MGNNRGGTYTQDTILRIVTKPVFGYRRLHRRRQQEGDLVVKALSRSGWASISNPKPVELITKLLTWIHDSTPLSLTSFRVRPRLRRRLCE